MKAEIIVLIFGAAAIILLLLMFGWEMAACHGKWEKSGFESSYGPIQGCIVNVNGRWLPSENYREMP